MNDIEKIEDNIAHLQNQLSEIMTIYHFIEEGNYKLKNETNNFDDLKIQTKFFGVLISSVLELYTITKGYLNSKLEWEKIYYIKSGYLIIYETVNNYEANRYKFRQTYSSEITISQFDAVNDRIKEFKKYFQFQHKISSIRNTIAGHIDKDFIKYYEKVLDLDLEEGLNAINKFVLVLHSLLTFIYKNLDELEERLKEPR